MEKVNVKEVDCTDAEYEEIFSNESIQKSGIEKEDTGFFSAIKKIWNKTIFPDIIKRKKEEREFKAAIRQRARMQALSEVEGELVKKYKQEELDKLTGNKKMPGWMGKLGKELSSMSDAAGRNMNSAFGMGSNVDVNQMLGGQSKQEVQYVNVPYNSRKKGKKKKMIVQQPKKETAEEKIRRMIG